MSIGGFGPDHVQTAFDGPRRLGRRSLRTED
jgi:hypothetical protein